MTELENNKAIYIAPDRGSIMLVNYTAALEEKLKKLKALVLLTDPAVSHIQMNSTSSVQWQEYVRCFPEEGK